MADARIKTTKTAPEPSDAEQRRRETKAALEASETQAATLMTRPEATMAYLAAIGLQVGSTYKSVYFDGSLLGNVTLAHIVGTESPDLTALVFQAAGVKTAPFQVVLLRALCSFTLAS